MAPKLDISILIPTYDRAEILRACLESLTALEPDGPSFEVVLVDNNSKDSTREVAQSFSDRLPLRYLFEPNPGKSCALNHALLEAELGELVVFADDDVVPRPDWLRQILDAARRYPAHNVFGGKIELIWPDVPVPGWARDSDVQFWALGLHDQGDEDRVYGKDSYPGGANYWVRGALLKDGPRFDSGVGPRPTNYAVMGTETSFLHALAQTGEGIMYIPSAVVGHMLQAYLLEPDYVKKRAYRWGRGMPHRGLCHEGLLQRSRSAWTALRIASLARHAIRYVGGKLNLSADRRMLRTLATTTCIGYDIESLKLAHRTRAAKRS